MKRGDRYQYPGKEGPLKIQVTRVARDGSWADILVVGEYSQWTKRQKLRPDGTFPFDVQEVSK